jgi:pyruvate/2-oxoglutarate dehydrogenase complex dihydrolipoamide dehydrogenase (E3) component
METPTNSYDVIVVGAGPVGQNVAARARAAGLSVAVVERELVGGECSYWACVPSKALLRPVIAVADARRIDGARESVTGPLDTAGVFGRRDRYVSNWDDSGQANAYVTGIGADLVRGHGRLEGPRRVAISTPGRPSRSASAAAQRYPTYRVSPRPTRGPIARAPTAAKCPAGSPLSAGAGSLWRWRPRGRASARR